MICESYDENHPRGIISAMQPRLHLLLVYLPCTTTLGIIKMSRIALTYISGSFPYKMPTQVANALLMLLRLAHSNSILLIFPNISHVIS